MNSAAAPGSTNRRSFFGFWLPWLILLFAAAAEGYIWLLAPADWGSVPPRLVWRQPCGGGYAGFAVAGNLAVTIEQRRDQEAVVGYDTATGRERWVHAYPAQFTEPLGGPGPRATPTIAGHDVF